MKGSNRGIRFLITLPLTIRGANACVLFFFIWGVISFVMILVTGVTCSPKLELASKYSLIPKVVQAVVAPADVPCTVSPLDEIRPLLAKGVYS